MKRALLIFSILISGFVKSQITYTFTSIAGAFTPNAGVTVLHGVGVDEGISAVTNIPFGFCFGGITYTNFQASSNGVMFLGTTAAGSNLTNNLTTGTDRPIIAPLWDDLQVGTGGQVNYRVTGVSPNRVLTVEWLNMEWNWLAAGPVITFQAKLYETTNQIQFCYRQDANAVNAGSASIGLGGQASGDFYSLNGTGATPVASKVTETSNLSTKPSTGRIYQWDPQLCSGTPLGGTAVATPSYACGPFTTTLTASGLTNACGVVYQWQTSGTSAAGPWTNFGPAGTTGTFAVTGTRWFRLLSTCGTSTAASSVAQTTINAAAACGLCGLTPITLPYTASGQTTCGQGNDLTAAMVTNACGSTNYLGGEDVIYTFTPAATGSISVTFSTSGSSAGAMLYSGCPNSGGTCSGSATGISSFSGNQTFCAAVTAGQPYFLVIDSWPTPTCNGYNINITAPINGSTGCSLSSYNAAGATYNFEAFVGTNAPSTDDVLFNSTVNLGFNFCYGGNAYTTCYIASNAAIVFDAVPCSPNIQTTTYAAPGVGTGWSITAAAPVNGTSVPRNAILGPWHDIDPSVGGIIEYATVGVAPNRRFIVSYDNVPMFSATCDGNNSLDFSGQIKIYETTNNIEIHIRSKQLCPSWNSGYAIMGLHNFNGTIYRPPVNATAHNFPTNWTMTNTAYMWSATCATCNILPVNYKSFYGERVNKINELYWETALEENISFYSVERSEDAEHFSEIAKVNPKNKPSLYSYDDYETKPGVMYYYRITAIEKDASRKQTNVIPLGSNLNEVMVSGIYPNPVQDEFVMSVDSRKDTELEVKIYDVVGKMVKSFTRSSAIGVQQMHFSVPELPAGSYMIEVRSADSQIVNQQKLLKVD